MKLILSSCICIAVVFTCISYVESNKVCYLAKTCIHNGQEQCGLNSDGDVRRFIDSCDILEFNCLKHTEFVKTSSSKCLGLPPIDEQEDKYKTKLSVQAQGEDDTPNTDHQSTDGEEMAEGEVVETDFIPSNEQSQTLINNLKGYIYSYKTTKQAQIVKLKEREDLNLALDTVEANEEDRFNLKGVVESDAEEDSTPENNESLETENPTADEEETTGTEKNDLAKVKANVELKLEAETQGPESIRRTGRRRSFSD